VAEQLLASQGLCSMELGYVGLGWARLCTDTSFDKLGEVRTGMLGSVRKVHRPLCSMALKSKLVKKSQHGNG
jgi:hypothetical protein